MPFSTLQTLMVLSSLPEIIYFSSGVKQTEVTLLIWPTNLAVSAPLYKFQIMMALSLPPDRMSVVSLLILT